MHRRRGGQAGRAGALAGCRRRSTARPSRPSREIPPGSPNYIADREGLARRCREGLNRILDGLKAEDLSGSLGRMIDAEKAEPSGSAIPEARKAADKERPAQKARKRGPGRRPDGHGAPARARQGPGAEPPGRGDRRAGRDTDPARSAQGARVPGRDAGGPAEAHPEDLSVGIAEALLALGTGDAKRFEPALDRLVALVDKTPLEALSEGARANSRQRAEAARQLPLWVVARACGKHGDSARSRVAADKLAARAIEAARRQSDNHALMAMLRERGDLALSRGDRSAAEAEWVRMLETVIEPRGRRPGRRSRPRRRRPRRRAPRRPRAPRR